SFQLERDRFVHAIRADRRGRGLELDVGMTPGLAGIIRVEDRGAEAPHEGKRIESRASAAPLARSQVADGKDETTAAELDGRKHRAVIALAHEIGVFPFLPAVCRGDVPDVVVLSVKVCFTASVRVAGKKQVQLPLVVYQRLVQT